MSRLHSTYGYLMGSVGITGATATALWRSGTTGGERMIEGFQCEDGIKR